MADNQDPRTDHFKQAEEAFSHLELDQKARFLAQEAVSTVLEAAQVVMDVVVEECEGLFESDSNADGETKKSSEPEAA